MASRKRVMGTGNFALYIIYQREYPEVEKTEHVHSVEAAKAVRHEGGAQKG